MIYENFADIEKDVQAKFPPILYKYRDWSFEFHRKILTENILWFPSPLKLNDPHDVRIPIKFDETEVHHPLFLEKLKGFMRELYPTLPKDARDIQILAENHLDRIKENPVKWFTDVYEGLRKDGTFDTFGILSLTSDPAQETMWAYYSNDYKGFCVGFDTVELARLLKMSMGPVDYRQEVFLYSFLNDSNRNEMQMYYIKNKKWEHEKEWRILNIGIENDSQRAIKFNPSIIKCVLLGSAISDKDQSEITEVLKNNYPSSVELFKVTPGISSYGLEKIKIIY